MGTGDIGNDENSRYKDFWEYDPAANVWTQKADFGGTARGGAFGFGTGSKGYIGGGTDITSNDQNDFWEYDPSANVWTRKADFRGEARTHAASFTIGTKGYIGTGYGATNTVNDFWEYNPSANLWTRKADFGGGARFRTVGFSIGGKGYMGTGYNSGTYCRDFWEYNPVTDTWTRKADFGGIGRYGAAGFSIGNKGYAGTGANGTNLLKDFWQYDPAIDAWTQKNNFGGTGRYLATGFSVNGKGYLGTGTDGDYSFRKDFWEYDPDYGYSWLPGGQTTSSITVTAPGNYSVTATNALGCTATSAATTVTVKPATQISTQPQAASVCTGSTVGFTVAATGANLSYRWKKGSTILSAATATLTITNVQPSDAGQYTVDVISDCGTVTSNAATLTVNTAPSIIQQPVGAAVCSGQSFNLSVVATGTGLSYQWKKNGVDMAYATKSDRTIPSVSAADAGNYSVVVSGSCGSPVTSDIATLVVNTAPVLTVPANITANSGEATCDATVSFAATATGLPAPSLAYTVAGAPVTSPYAFPPGTTTVTAVATNGCGSDSKTFTVTIEDKTAPDFTPPASRAVYLGANCSLTVPDFITGLTGTDNCGTVTFSQSPAAGTVLPSANRSFEVAITANDGHGNTTSYSVMLQGKDGTPPTVTAPPAVTVATDAGKCSAGAVALGNPTYSDNCSGVTVSNNAPPVFAKGITKVIWTATDGAGNKASDVQTVTVADREAPVAQALPAITAECSATVTPVNGTDNCAGAVVPATKDPLTYTAQGTYTIHWTYSDGAGNSTAKEQTVVVKDTTKPVPDTATLPDITGECSVTVASKPTATDNCAGKITATTTDPTSYSTQGTYVIHWTYDDGNGNSSAQEQTVTVKDVTKPVPDVPTLPDITGECSVSITAKPTAMDNCAGTLTGTTVDPLAYTAQGTYVIHWNYDDGNGNSSTQTQRVVIKDITRPVADVTNLPDLTGECGVTVTGKPTATDNCAEKLTASTADPLSYSAQGTYIIHWTYSDGNGNVSTQEQKIVVKDATKPVPNVTVLPDVTGECSVTVTSTPTAGDNCAGNTTGTTTDPLTYTAQGTYAITWTYNDGHGNSSTQTQKVVVKDATLPLITAPASLTVSADNGKCTASGVALGAPVYSDNCTVASIANNAPTVFPNGVTTVTWTVTDAAGNKATATQTVTVQDTQKPLITPPATTAFCYTASGTYGIALLQATDNCGITSITYGVTGATSRTGTGADANGAFNPGTSTITWTVKDASGNTAIGQTTVVVNTALTVSIPDAKVLSSGVEGNTVYLGYAPASAITLSANATGGSGAYAYKWSTGAGLPFITVSPGSATTYTVTVTDPKGCTGTASKMVQVVNAACGAKVNVCHHGNNTLCIDKTSVPDHLAHGDYLGDCPGAAATTQTTATGLDLAIEEAKALAVTASPNPSTACFTLRISTGDEKEKITLTVTDVVGRVVETRAVNAGTVRMGDNYLPGVYIAAVLQGAKKATVKLVRQ